MAIDPKWIVNLKGKDHPLYAGLLAEAHERGLGSIETHLIQVPTPENGNVAIVKATVKMYPGLGGEEFSDRPPPFRVFEGYGDADPGNVAKHLVGALIRMAETRAKGRALRDAINCGQTMLEELPDLEEVRQESRGDRYAREMPEGKWGAPKAPIAGAAAREDAERKGVPLVRHSPGTPEGDAAMSQVRLVCSEEGCGTILRPAQVTLSEQRYGRRLCAVHQEEAASA